MQSTNSISYGRIGAKYYFRYVKNLLCLFVSIILLACGNTNNLNEEELRTYLIGGKWITDTSACTFSTKYTADSVLMFTAKVKWPSIGIEAPTMGKIPLA